MRTYKLTYRENNRTQELGTFGTQNELDVLIKAECALIQEESAMYSDDRDQLIDKLLVWAASQWNPNADRTMVFTYPDSRTTGTYRIEELPSEVTVTFAYAPGVFGPQPEDISTHVLESIESARNLVSFNMDNEGLRSITIEFK